MEKREVIFDVSAYMLFEASGDSDGALAAEYSGAAEAAAEDDAESVSDCGRVYEIEIDLGDDFRGQGFQDFYGMEEDDGGSEEEEGVVDQCRRGRKVAPPEVKAEKKSMACEESANSKLMNEKERDRLFWESCLAS